MHQNAARGVEPRLAVSICAVKVDTSLPHRVHVFSLVGKLRRVMHHQDRPAGCQRTIARRLKVTTQNLRFADSIVVENSIRRLRVCPVLANQRDAVARTRGELFEQRSESLAQAFINEVAVGEFAVDSRVVRFFVGNRRVPALSNIVVRHGAPCESGTRIIRISSSRITCKNYLQSTENK